MSSPISFVGSAGAKPATRQGLPALTLAALGVVYGDIGTSPLYTVAQIFTPATSVPLDEKNIVGAVSVIFWALMLVVTLKYVLLILRADNHGEGGILALASLAAAAVARRTPRKRAALLLLGVAGATLFYGDSLITPAISVMGAMEGLEIVAPALKTYVVPLSMAVLVGLFLVQRRGSGLIGKAFGPVMVLWFACLATTGVLHIAQQPVILQALNPLHAWHFLLARGWQIFAVVGAIVLALTGAEALYADLGHFGRRPIQVAWIGMVLPALTLNYMGQGALLIGNPSAIDSPFFRMFPSYLTLPSVIVATMAAIIASQAVITGAYSMTRQAIQLGFLPRMEVRYTSANEAGQIYLPGVNWVLLIAVLAAVVAFRSSGALAGAYGIAVTLTMLITTLLTWFVLREAWRWSLPIAWSVTLFFLTLDLLLVTGCIVKLFDGGWLPLAVGALLFIIMSTWSEGRAGLMAAARRDGIPLKAFLASLDRTGSCKVARTAVFLVAEPSTVPEALLHNMKHNQVLHTCNIIVHVSFHEVPWVAVAERVNAESLGGGFWQVTLNFGFMDTPDVPEALGLCSAPGLDLAPMRTSYFLSRTTPIPFQTRGLSGWRKKLFASMMRDSASKATRFFRLPDNAVIELGTRVCF
nr:potassium transporter Kup [Comamonas koreensis]